MIQQNLFPDHETPDPTGTSGLVTDQSILDLAVPLIKGFEGFRSSPYLDGGGVPTIGYGTTRYEDGRRVTMQDAPVTQDQATAILLHKIQTQFLPAVKTLCPTLTTSSQYAAVLSFTYNVGVAALTGSTLRKKILAGDMSGAALEFPRWNMDNGKVIPGLTHRRLIEQSQFLSNVLN